MTVYRRRDTNSDVVAHARALPRRGSYAGFDEAEPTSRAGGKAKVRGGADREDMFA